MNDDLGKFLPGQIFFIILPHNLVIVLFENYAGMLWAST